MQSNQSVVLICILYLFGVFADTCDFVDLVAAQFTGCGTLGDGTVQCWGSPVANLPTTPLKSIVAGNAHFCGLRNDNTAYCWGAELGPTPTDAFTKIDAGYFATCGIRLNGTIACWGNSTLINNNIPSGTFVYVGVGKDSACGITTSNSLTCWGNFPIVTSTAIPTGNDFVQVSLNVDHACALRSSGNATCWYKNITTAVSAFLYSSIDTGEGYTCGITKDTGILKCWGSSNDFFLLPREQEVLSISISTDWGNFCVKFKNQTYQCERGPMPTNCTHIGTSTSSSTSSSVATTASTSSSVATSSSTTSSVATSSTASSTAATSSSSVATSTSAATSSVTSTSSAASTTGDKTTTATTASTATSAAESTSSSSASTSSSTASTASSSATSSSTSSSVTTGTSSTTGTTQNYTKIVVPLDGNVTVTYPAGDSAVVNITIPFVIDNSTAEIVEADPSNPVYVNPDGETAPGSFKGSSFFITIYDSKGKEVRANFTDPIKIVLEGNFGVNDKLYYFDTDLLIWLVAGESCPSDRQLFSVVNGVMTVNICHLTQFAVFAPSEGTSSGADVLSSSVAVSLFALAMVL